MEAPSGVVSSGDRISWCCRTRRSVTVPEAYDLSSLVSQDSVQFQPFMIRDARAVAVTRYDEARWSSGGDGWNEDRQDVQEAHRQQG